ncbi:CD180 antigen-like [Branchiostoma floridae]|uniref:CD180 antigen-like n=1 Tax=Branchiostoma floridae TaxID=7739 RepID=A0A9J7MWJ1_BRAFL|nr:CD180 antigen-like [Branchiostoma floridae]
MLILEKNRISAVSQHAFRGLHLLKHLRLSHNRLTSVPVGALLRPESLWIADLQMNHITTIGRDVVRLSRNQRLSLQIGHNKLRCDKNLTWFICTLPYLPFISQHDVLRCTFPPELSGTSLTAMRKYLCQTSTERPQRGIGSKPFSEPSLTPTSTIMGSTSPQIFNAHPYSDAIPTEGYTEMPQTMSVTERTTLMDYAVTNEGNPFIN